MRCWLNACKSIFREIGNGHSLQRKSSSLLLLAFALFTIHTAFSQKSRDTIFFRNGSIVIGKIKNVKLGVITFDPMMPTILLFNYEDLNL
jgi:hypothetical protein